MHFPLTPSIDELGRIIGTVAAPAFLLGAVAAFISVLIARINRVVDRSRFIYGMTEANPSRSNLKDDLPRLKRRAALLHRAIFYAVVAALLTALIIIVAFVSAMFSLAHEYGVAVLFVAALTSFCMSLIALARELNLALTDAEFQV